MFFCRILSTLCSHVVFHNIPHIFRGWQKSGTKSTSYNRSGTKCKTPSTFGPALLKSAKNIVNKVIYPVLYCPLFPTKICWAILYVLIIKLTKGWDGGFRKGGIRDRKIGDREIEERGCEAIIHGLSLIWEACRYTVPPAVALINYMRSGIHWRIFSQIGTFRGVFSTHH
jgi:hypothetical protein